MKIEKHCIIFWLKSVCRTNVHPSKGASPCSPLNNGASPFLKGERTYARAYSPFWRVNEHTHELIHPSEGWTYPPLRVKHPSWKVNEGWKGWKGWSILKGERIRVNEGFFTLMKGERNKDESNKGERRVNQKLTLEKNTTLNTDIIKFMWNNLKNESKRIRLKYFNWILRFCKLSSSVLNQPGSTHFRILVEYTNDKSVKCKKMYHSHLYFWFNCVSNVLGRSGLTENTTVKWFSCIWSF